MKIETEILTSNANLREAIYLAHKGRCFYTGRKVEFDRMEIDHIVPISCGGKNCIVNYVLTTPALNRRKNDKINFELVDRMLYLNRILFAPLALKNYLKSIAQEDGYTQVRIYLKINYRYLLPYSNLISQAAKTILPYLHKHINPKSSQKTFLFEIDKLDAFVKICKLIIDTNKKDVTQAILQAGHAILASCDLERQDKPKSVPRGNRDHSKSRPAEGI